MAKHYYVSENVNEGTFEDWETIVDSTFEMNFDADYMEKDGVPIVSDGHLARGYSLEQPMMVVAATGSGKTRRLIIQFLISCILSACSMLINDPKGELYKHTKKMLEKLGYKIIVVDLRNLDYGERFNFCEHPARLYKAGFTRRADEMFQAMFDTFMATVRSEKDPFWHTTGAAYLTGLAELCCDIFPAEKVTINTIYELHIQGNKRFGADSYLKTYLEMHEDKPYYKLIAPYINAPNDTRASLDAVLTSAISKFCRNSSVVDQTTNSTFEISDLVEKKTALFIISRDESTVYNALITAMVNEIYEVVIDMAEEKYNGRLPRRLSIVLDEFGNLAPIDDINAKITVSRSRNVGWCLCCQSLDQLTLKYTADVAKIILGNCNIAYMYSSDINLLKMLSDLCGKTTDEYTHESKPLLSVEQLRHFNKDEGQTLFLLERMRPFVGFLPDISEYNIVPEEKAEFKKRKLQIIERVDFESIVKEEKNRQMAEKMNSRKENTSFGRRPSVLPSFEEFIASQSDNLPGNPGRKSDKTSSEEKNNSIKSSEIKEKKPRDKKSDGVSSVKLEDGTNEELPWLDEDERNARINQLIANIDRHIAEIEEKERKEQKRSDNYRNKQKKAAEKDSLGKKNSEMSEKKATSAIVFKNIESFEKTSAVISEYLEMPSESGNNLLRQALSKGHCTIKGIPSEKAAKMITEFKRIGTIAAKIDYVV